MADREPAPEPKKRHTDELHDVYAFNSTNVLRVLEDEDTSVTDRLIDVLQISGGKCEDVLASLVVSKCGENDEDQYATKLIVNYWIMRCPNASWRWLIWQYDRTNKNGRELAKYLQAYAENLTDPTLTVSNVSSVVSTVKHRTLLQIYFDVSSPKMEEMEQSSPTEAHCREEIVKYWLMYSPFASWEWLAGSLYYYQEEEVLRAVKPFMRMKREPSLTTEHLEKVFDEAEYWRLRYRYICRQLQIPESKVQEALAERGDKPYDVDPTQSVVLAKLFLDTHPAPSWKLVAQALWSEEEWEAAEIVYTKYFKEINLEDLCIETVSTFLKDSKDVELLPLPSLLKSKLIQMIETYPLIKLQSF